MHGAAVAFVQPVLHRGVRRVGRRRTRHHDRGVDVAEHRFVGRTRLARRPVEHAAIPRRAQRYRRHQHGAEIDTADTHHFIPDVRDEHLHHPRVRDDQDSLAGFQRELAHDPGGERGVVEGEPRLLRRSADGHAEREKGNDQRSHSGRSYPTSREPESTARRIPVSRGLGYDRAMRVINRTAITVVGIDPYLEWTRQKDADVNKGALTVARAKTYGSAFLLPEFELEEDVQEWVEDNATLLFEFQLAAWTDDESAWPAARDLNTFRQWFRVDIHSVVVDVADDDIEGEEL